MRIFTCLSASLVLATAMIAPVAAAPVTYVIDSTHTFPRFTYKHLGLSTQVNRFSNTTGTIVYDAEAKTAQVDITIDMTSVDTGSETFNGHIQGADFFDTATYPEATFKSTSVTFDGDSPSAIEGDLTIKGVTLPVTLTLSHFVSKPHPMLKKDAVGADASVTVKRSDFNAGKYAPAIDDDVRIDVSLEAIAQ